MIVSLSFARVFGIGHLFDSMRALLITSGGKISYHTTSARMRKNTALLGTQMLYICSYSTSAPVITNLSSSLTCNAQSLKFQNVISLRTACKLPSSHWRSRRVTKHARIVKGEMVKHIQFWQLVNRFALFLPLSKIMARILWTRT